jgi:hypothetical protein
MCATCRLSCTGDALTRAEATRLLHIVIDDPRGVPAYFESAIAAGGDWESKAQIEHEFTRFVLAATDAERRSNRLSVTSTCAKARTTGSNRRAADRESGRLESNPCSQAGKLTRGHGAAWGCCLSCDLGQTKLWAPRRTERPGGSAAAGARDGRTQCGEKR